MLSLVLFVIVCFASAYGGPQCRGSHVYHATGTGYYPDPSPLEGGYNDMRGNKLRTLQAYLKNQVSYVSVAMDNHAGIAYGTVICIQEMNNHYNRNIVFKVVDTGGAFAHKGHSRIDICTGSQHDSYSNVINGPLTLYFP